MSVVRGTALGRVSDALLEPVVDGLATAARESARLLATMLVITIAAELAVVATWALAPAATVADVEAAVALMAFVGSVGAYAFARRGGDRVAAWMFIAITSGAVFALELAALARLNPLYMEHDGAVLMFLAIPIFIAGTFLPWRQVLAVGAMELAGCLPLPLLLPRLTYAELLPGSMALVFFATLLVSIAGAHRERLEYARAKLLRDEIDSRRRAQDELREHRDELERLVAERTRGLEEANAELVEANEAKSRFLANMSHELRTPLNSIIGFTGTIRQGLAGPLTEEQAHQLTMVDRSSRHLLALINQVLDLSRIEAGHVRLDMESFPIHDLLTDVRDSMMPLAEMKDLRLEIEAPPDVAAATITSDRGKVRQVLLNLTGNAIKFTHEGVVTLSAGRRDGTVSFTVVDTGVGIASTDTQTIFDAYRQIQGTDGAKPLGTGLGLTVSQRLAKLLGGGIAVESEVGVGSRFTLTVRDGRVSTLHS